VQSPYLFSRRSGSTDKVRGGRQSKGNRAMIRQLASRIGLLALVVMAIVSAEPRLTLAFEDNGDPRPQRFALTGEVMGKVLGLVISWSGGARQLIH
jgi:hypothetical protein